MPTPTPNGFYVYVDPSGALVLRGELDMSTVPDLLDKLDELMVPGQAIVFDLAQLTFVDSSGIACMVGTRAVTRHSVVFRNTPPAIRRVLHMLDGYLTPEAWVFDGGDV